MSDLQLYPEALCQNLHKSDIRVYNFKIQLFSFAVSTKVNLRISAAENIIEMIRQIRFEVIKTTVSCAGYASLKIFEII